MEFGSKTADQDEMGQKSLKWNLQSCIFTFYWIYNLFGNQFHLVDGDASEKVCAVSEDHFKCFWNGCRWKRELLQFVGIFRIKVCHFLVLLTVAAGRLPFQPASLPGETSLQNVVCDHYLWHLTVSKADPLDGTYLWRTPTNFSSFC